MTLQYELQGNQSKGEIGERNNPTIGNRLSIANRGLSTTYGPTDLNRKSLQIAKNALPAIGEKVDKIVNQDIPALAKMLNEIGAPYIQGTKISQW